MTVKKVLAFVIAVFLLSGCAKEDVHLKRGMALREKMISAETCSFTAHITADYGDKTYTFSMDCSADREGNVSFTVRKPDSISGISGVLSSNGGKLTFDDTALAFPLLADGEVSPVSAPWLLIHTLRSGYLSSCAAEEERIRLTINDSYEADALQLDIWLDDHDMPVSAEIVWQGRRVLSLTVEDFAIV